MPPPSDRDLVLSARRGEAEAYGELVRRYQTAVFNAGYRLLGNRQEAEDLAQEAFIRAYARLDSFDVNRPFGPWIGRVAVNLGLNRLHSAGPPGFSLDDERDEPLSTPDENPEAAREHAERAEALRAALVSL